MTTPKLFLLTGIPGTGKTTYGDDLAKLFGFAHYDIEDPATGERLISDSTSFIQELLRHGKDTVVTWGFNPVHQPSVSAVLQLKNSGFKLIWFDGNRPAALRAFIKRATVPEVCFYLQMYRIEVMEIINTVKPAIVNPFNEQGQFKSAEELLQELRRS